MDRDEPATVTSAHTPGEDRTAGQCVCRRLPDARRGRARFFAQSGQRKGSRREEAAMDAVTEEGIQGQLRSPARSQNITYADVALLAWHFEVSYAAAVWRLRGLNLASAEQTQTLLDQTEEARQYQRTVRATFRCRRFRRRGAYGPRTGLADSVAGPGSLVARGDFAEPSARSGPLVGY